MFPKISCHPSGTMLLRTKALYTKHMRRLIPASVDYILGKRYIWNYTRMLSTFHCGRMNTTCGMHVF